MVIFIEKLDMKTIGKEIFVGIIIAAVSIPIGMGYAQVSGLPPVYGLYGSMLPILVFCLVSSSKEFIFGVDAAPAALIGGILISFNIESGSEEAVKIIPVITFYVSIWLLLFFIFRAGKLVNYISTPVMGGFISGIAVTIIMMQIPKIMGYTSGHGELLELTEHFFESLRHINMISLIMGVSSILIILITKRISPRFPMSLFVMILGALSTIIFHVDKYGVVLLAKVDSGLPKFVLPDLNAISLKNGLMLSLPIAIVILAESLLTGINFSMKNNYKINENREILAYSLGNFASALTGCCPVNGSASRTSISDQYNAKTKIVSITACILMAGVLLFGTGFIGYLPVPVLTAIVISALTSVIEIDIAKKLYRINKTEFFIFIGAFAGVLILGTIYGVLVGLILSFTAMILKSAVPPRCFLGVIPGREGFYNIQRNRAAMPISGVIIYRFSGSLFFANVNTFQDDIENNLRDDTKAVIVDASGIGSIDCTAAERLEIIYKSFEQKGIEFYITEHVGELNDEMRRLGLGHIIEKGGVRRTIEGALCEADIVKPYPVEENIMENNGNSKKALMMQEEFEWAFGKDSEEEMDRHVEEIINSISAYTESFSPEDGIKYEVKEWRHLPIYDQDTLLEHLEIHLNDLAEKLGQPVDIVERNIIEHRIKLAEKMQKINQRTYEEYIEKRKTYEKLLKKNNNKLFEYIMEQRKKQYDILSESGSKVTQDIKNLFY